MENQTDQPKSRADDKSLKTPADRNYTVFQALQEMLAAVKRNPLSVALSLLVSYGLAIAATIATFAAMTAVVLGQFGLLFASLTRVLIVLVVGFVVYTLLFALVYAFTVSSLAFSMSPEKYGIGKVLKKTIDAFPRVVKVNAWVAVVSYWPVAAAAVLPLLSLSSASVAISPLAALSPILMIGAFIWALIAQLRFALAPYVALFEPEVPVKQTLKRSQDLLKGEGQQFIFSGCLMLLAIIIYAAVVTKSNVRQLENSHSWAVNVLFVVLFILSEGAMIMLYFNRAAKHNPKNTPRSPRLLFVTILVIVGLLATATVQGRSNKIGGALSANDQAAFAKIINDVDRKVEIREIADALEGYYSTHGYYPASADIASTDWVAKNLTISSGGQASDAMGAETLTDPNEKYINAEGSDYRYTVSPENCTQCASFELSTKLEQGGEYKKPSLNSSVKTVSDAAQTPPATTATPSPKTDEKISVARELYKIGADGTTAQLSPVTVSFSGADTVELHIDLQCVGTCQFKLASDTYALSDTTTYSSSQKIVYQITKPGVHVFYNQYLPDIKFKISF